MNLKRSLASRLPETLLARVRQLRGVARKIRMDERLTRIFGPRYKRSRTLIEIDITWACNLRCFNCNRSCEQAPTGESMTIDQVKHFVDENIAAGQRWKRIRVLGGEPTIHPHFDAIIDELLRYRDAVPDVIIEVATHGCGERTHAALGRLPDGVRVDNTHKETPTQQFDTFNVAPVDLPAYDRADFRNGCAVTESCGVGLGPYGYYPCAVAAGIDRVMGYDLGRKTLPTPDDDMNIELATFCRVCGHFKREHTTPVTGSVRSSTWDEAYRRWYRERPSLGTYGCRQES